MFVFEPNKYQIKNGIAIFETKSGISFIVDVDDVEKILDYGWNVNKKGYVVASSRHRTKNGRINLRLHRLITDCPSHMVVDHINHDTLDNRKSNLRVCTQDENMRNRNPDRHSKSGIKGVYPENGKWRAMISYNRKQYRLGTFADINEAIQARQKAEVHFYGDFANLQNTEGIYENRLEA